MYTNPYNRREFLKLTSRGVGALTLSSLINSVSASSGYVPKLHHAPKAKSVIFLYMSGGVSHVDSFDPKPLLRELHGIPALRRLAFITSHPNFLSPDLIDVLAELPKLSRYLHLPAQSGSNAMLKAMRRGYTVERYKKRIEQLWAKVPDMELHSDFIVGYPGETEEDFEATVALMKELRFSQSYIFKYSARPGTVSSELVDDVSMADKNRRNQVLLDVQEELSAEKNQAMVGQTVEILVEGASKVAGRLTGRTSQHRLVHFEASDQGLYGQYVPVKVTEALAHSCLGELLAHDAAEMSAADQSNNDLAHADDQAGASDK